jgi:hypothetical protein
MVVLRTLNVQPATAWRRNPLPVALPRINTLSRVLLTEAFEMAPPLLCSLPLDAQAAAVGIRGAIGAVRIPRAIRIVDRVR